jgi:uncharacterized membrane protein YphA (DoxX/SURF4 family)
MNFRNRKLIIVVRTLLGLFLVFSGISGLYAGTHGMSGVPVEMVPSSTQLWNFGIFQMIKVTEIVAGFMLVVGFLPALAAIFIAPIGVGIIVYDIHIAPAYLASGIIVCVLNAYLGYAYWDKYKSLFERK